MYQYKSELPFVLGGEFTGVVREASVGSEVSPVDRGELFATEDHREGVRSFLKRREPRHVGR